MVRVIQVYLCTTSIEGTVHGNTRSSAMSGVRHTILRKVLTVPVLVLVSPGEN